MNSYGLIVISNNIFKNPVSTEFAIYQIIYNKPSILIINIFTLMVEYLL